MKSYEMDKGKDWVQLCNGDDVFLWTSERMVENFGKVPVGDLEMLELFMNRKDELELLTVILDRGWTLIWRKSLGDYIFERMNTLLKVVDEEILHNVYFKFMLI